MDKEWNWKLNVRKQGHRLSVIDRILHMLDEKTLIAYINGLVLFQANTADCPEAKSIEISSEGFVYTAISKKKVDIWQYRDCKEL